MTVRSAATPRVRVTVQADLLEILRIERDSFPQPWPLAAFERFVGDRGFLVAESDGGVVGYVVADVEVQGGHRVGHIKDIAVREDARNQGIGSSLLSRAISVLASDGAKVIKLEVRESNQAAAGLYRSFGFDHRHTVPEYYDNGEDALVMVAERPIDRQIEEQ